MRWESRNKTGGAARGRHPKQRRTAIDEPVECADRTEVPAPPLLGHEEIEDEDLEDEDEEAQAPDDIIAEERPPARRRRKNFLQRTVIPYPTHFWPRSWRRAWKRRASEKARRSPG